MATDLQNMRAIRSGLIAQLAAETAYCVANGPKPTYTIDGENVQWTEWRDKTQAAIEKWTAMIQTEQVPFIQVSRARP